MKRFAARLLLLVPILLGVILTSWFVDPDHIRDPDSYERGIAHLLLDGQAVTNVNQPDEAAVMIHYFSGLSSAPDVIVLGSSRLKLLRADSFPGQTFFNASISGGSLIDYMALASLIEARGLLPRTLVIEMSTWFVGSEVVSVWPRFESLQPALEAHLLSGAPAPDVAAYTPAAAAHMRFLSPDYFQLSLFTFLDARFGDAAAESYHVLRPGEEPTGLTYLADGSEIFPLKRRRNLGSESVVALAIQAGQSPLGVPPAILPERQRVIEAFLLDLQSKGVEIVLFLGPYHPATYEIMMGNQYRIVAEIQTYYEDLARRHGFRIVGSYNPADLGLDGSVYYDATHITSESLAEIFRIDR
ncbi:MAG: hypothetical protein HFACDABA_02897 [Anaerolineales bacterium]|nr:hypothetical protein [Anaerolineales bacterium]